MPVLDHPVHEKVKKSGHHEWCWNNRSTPAEGFWADDKEFIGDRWVRTTKFIPNRFSRLCRQPGAYEPLPGCIGCQHLGEDAEYEAKMKALL